MKKPILLVLVIFVLGSLTGCTTMRVHTRSPSMRDSKIPELHISESVSLVNPLKDKGDELIGTGLGRKVYGNYYKFTESAIGAAKEVLAKDNVNLGNNGSKTIEMEVHDVTTQGSFVFTVTLSLRVKTGNGIEKDYKVSRKHDNLYGTTSVIEKLIAQSVEQMFNDKDILNYLQS